MRLLVRATMSVIMEVLSGKKKGADKQAVKKFEVVGDVGKEAGKEGEGEEGKKGDKAVDKESLMSAEGRSTITRVISLIGPEV